MHEHAADGRLLRSWLRRIVSVRRNSRATTVQAVSTAPFISPALPMTLQLAGHRAGVLVAGVQIAANGGLEVGRIMGEFNSGRYLAWKACHSIIPMAMQVLE